MQDLNAAMQSVPPRGFIKGLAIGKLTSLKDDLALLL